MMLNYPKMKMFPSTSGLIFSLIRPISRSMSGVLRSELYRIAFLSFIMSPKESNSFS